PRAVRGPHGRLRALRGHVRGDAQGGAELQAEHGDAPAEGGQLQALLREAAAGPHHRGEDRTARHSERGRHQHVCLPQGLGPPHGLRPRRRPA
ncbi:unnamed protein product, partial [Heterosigma akashiwo]